MKMRFCQRSMSLGSVLTLFTWGTTVAVRVCPYLDNSCVSVWITNEVHYRTVAS